MLEVSPLAASLLSALLVGGGSPAWNPCTPNFELGLGQSGADAAVFALARHDDGTGPALFATGQFGSVGGTSAVAIARWDGVVWSVLGSGLGNEGRALAVHDDGSGEALFVGGLFQTAGGQPALRIARWHGGQWGPVGGGFDNRVNALVRFDDGKGGAPQLIAGGTFSTAGGQAAARVARWDGATWSPLGGGVNGPVRALAVFDEGQGPALFAAGNFTTAGTAAAARIARWNGGVWSRLDSGLTGEASALCVHDDGNGPALYVAGDFAGAGGQPANRVARWNGSTWSALGTGLDAAGLTLASFDDGTAPALVVGGTFTAAGGVAAPRLARWKDAAWSSLGLGADGAVQALSAYTAQPSRRPELAIGGAFGQLDGKSAGRIGLWAGCAPDPLLLSLSPDAVPAALPTDVTVQTSHVPDGAAVLVLGGLEVPIVMANGAGVAQVPPLGSASSSDVVVPAYLRWETMSGPRSTAPIDDAYRWIVPQIVAVDPPAVPFNVATGVEIELAQNALTSGVGLVRFGNAPPVLGTWSTTLGVTRVQAVSAPQVAPGDYAIELELTEGGVTEYTRVESRALLFLAPGLLSLNQLTGFQGGGELVTFALTGFVPGVFVSVQFGSALSGGVPIGTVDQAFLTVVTPLSAVSGVVDVTISQDLGGGQVKTVVSPSLFQYLSPTIGALSPPSGTQLGGDTVVVALAGWAPGNVQVELGGVQWIAEVQGSAGNQTLALVTPAAPAPGPVDLRLVQGVFDVTAASAFTYGAPAVLSAVPAQGAWYQAQSVVLQGANFAPGLPAAVHIGGQGPLNATVLSPTQMQFQMPAGFLAGAGPQALTVEQAAVQVGLPGGWSSLPALEVTVLGSASAGGVIELRVKSVQGGLAYHAAAAALSPVPFTLTQWHYQYDLDLSSSLSLGAGGLLLQPTLGLPFPAGVLPPGLTLPIQAVVIEIGPLGDFYSLTNTAALQVP